jgi:nitroreductase
MVQEGRNAMSVSYDSPSHAAFHLARAAACAPSLHNTQPWLFVADDQDLAFEIHTDAARRLPLTDPGGREMVISCGAALFNTRVAVRHLGFRPAVSLLPEPRNPAFLARVGWGAYAAATREVMLMEHAIAQRHTHRGQFTAEPVPQSLIDELRAHALAEGALLHIIDRPEPLRLLAETVRVAEAAHRADPGHVAEVTGLSGSARRSWLERVPAEACGHNPGGALLAGRDYTGLTDVCDFRPRRRTPRTGTVAVLTTAQDTRTDWLRAGQALQRLLLYAAAHRVMAAFHTQPLELPELRAELQARLTADHFPQMILRLGRATHARTTPRRPTAAVLLRSRPGGAVTAQA